MSKKHLAFDLGASSGRAIIGWLENDKLQLQEVYRFTNHPHEENGRWYWDFTKLTGELETGLQKACEIADDLETFSVDTWGVDIVFMRDGKAIRQPYSYRDERFVKAQNDVHARISTGDCFAYTGIQDLAFNTVFQLYADKEDHPEDFTDNAKVLFMPDALLAALTGEMTTEYTIASTGEILDPETRKIHSEFLKRLDIPSDVLTEIVEPGTFGAPLSDSVRKKLGIPGIRSVKCCSHDTASAVASLPDPNAAENAYISLGTWALLGAEITEPNLSGKAFQAHYTNEGGLAGTIRFLTNITGTWLLQETRKTWNDAGENISFGEMCDLAMESATEKRINPNDPMFSAPGDMPSRIAEYCRQHGQGEFSSRGEMLRCIYESLADCFKAKLKELEVLQGKTYKKLHILGGGTKDEFLMQLTADKIGIPVLAGPVEATAAGNILVQLLTSGEISSLAEGRKLIARSFQMKEYLPRPE